MIMNLPSYEYKKYTYMPEIQEEPEEVSKIFHDVYVDGKFAFSIDKSPYVVLEEQEFIQICEKKITMRRLSESQRNTNYNRIKKYRR